MSESHTLKEVESLILNETRIRFMKYYEISPRKMNLFYISKIKKYLDEDIELAQNLQNLKSENILHLLKKTSIEKSSFKVFYSYYLSDCGLLSSAYDLVEKSVEESENHRRGYLFLNEWDYALENSFLKRLNTFNSIDPKLQASNTNSFRNFSNKRRNFQRNIHKLLSQGRDISVSDSVNYNEIISFILSALAYTVSFSSKSEIFKQINYFSMIRGKIDSFLEKFRIEIKEKLNLALILVEDSSNIELSDLNQNKDGILLNNSFSDHIGDLITKYGITTFDLIKKIHTQITKVIFLLEKLSSIERNKFLENYWRQFIKDINESAHLIDVFSSNPILTEKDLVFYIILKDIYSVSKQNSQLYEKIISLLDNCNKREFALIQQARFRLYTMSRTETILNHNLKPFIKGLLSVVIKEPFTISDLKLMRKLEITVCREIMNYWFLPIQRVKEYKFIYFVLRNIIFDFFKDEDIIISSKLVSCFYLDKNIPSEYKDFVLDEIIEKIFDIISILVDKRTEKDLVTQCVESQKIIQFFTEIEARVLESAKLIESVWKDDDILRNIEKYLQNIRKIKERPKSERK